MQFIDLAAQYRHLQAKIDARIQRVLAHGQYIMGPEVHELEAKLAAYVGVKHAISCANGTDALQLTMMAYDIKKGDAVFCPTFTFVSTAEAPALMGASPIFIDSDSETFNLCPLDLEKKIQQVLAAGELNAKAIVAVDLFGLPANYPKLQKLATKYHLKLIEDAAQGFGGQIEGRRAGSFGQVATTSFFPAKPLGCYGDGGAVFTNDDELAALVRSYRVHGKGTDKYDNLRIGMNSRLDTIQAAILLEKLAAFPQELIQRNDAAKTYAAALPTEWTTPQLPAGYQSSWAQYTVIHPQRDEIMARYRAQGIPTTIYYKTCLHQQTAFKNLRPQRAPLPRAEALAQTVFSLPMHPYLQPETIKKIAKLGLE